MYVLKAWDHARTIFRSEKLHVSYPKVDIGTNNYIFGIFLVGGLINPPTLSERSSVETSGQCPGEGLSAHGITPRKTTKFKDSVPNQRRGTYGLARTQQPRTVPADRC